MIIKSEHVDNQQQLHIYIAAVRNGCNSTFMLGFCPPCKGRLLYSLLFNMYVEREAHGSYYFFKEDFVLLNHTVNQILQEEKEIIYIRTFSMFYYLRA